MNKKILAVILGIFVIGMFSLALAKTEEVGQKEARQTIEPQGNNTFGNCVSDAAAVKNTCYQTVKAERATCKSDAQNQTEPKPALKNCLNTYKKDLKQCKMDFKSDKNECKKIKHNVFESMGAAFK